MTAVNHIVPPRAAGYRMPPEWAPHERCWMQWPDARELVWPDLTATQTAYAQVARAVRHFEPVTVIVNEASLACARELCGPRIDFLIMEIDDAWARDSGPNFVVRDTDHGGTALAASLFGFNAWGQKYPRYRNDAAVGHRIAEHLQISTFTASVFMEGGGINVDGEGTILTSESCILNANRNPGLGREDAEQILCDALGGNKVIWVPGDADDRETDGHVDGVACFVRPGVVLCSAAARDDPERRRMLDENAKALARSTDARGRRLEVIRLEEASGARPPAGGGERFCRSYINFYIANGGVIVPSYGIEADAAAAALIGAVFPGREVVTVAAADIAVGGGAIHCITQQQPFISA